MHSSPAAFGAKSDCAGEVHQQFTLATKEPGTAQSHESESGNRKQILPRVPWPQNQECLYWRRPAEICPKLKSRSVIVCLR
jgi:hypothetical protein